MEKEHRIFKEFISNKNQSFPHSEFDYDLMAKYKHIIGDSEYFDFIIGIENGGYFFNDALQLYSFSNMHEFNNIDMLNSVVAEEYAEIFGNIHVFGQDVFANQFAFDLDKGTIVFLDTGSGEKNVIAKSFGTFLSVLLGDLEYYTGSKFVKEYFKSLQFSERLCPKIPFIMGGEYSKENLYASSFPKYIKANANIARQVYNLPNGTQVKLKIENLHKN